MNGDYLGKQADLGVNFRVNPEHLEIIFAELFLYCTSA